MTLPSTDRQRNRKEGRYKYTIDLRSCLSDNLKSQHSSKEFELVSHDDDDDDVHSDTYLAIMQTSSEDNKSEIDFSILLNDAEIRRKNRNQKVTQQNNGLIRVKCNDRSSDIDNCSRRKLSFQECYKNDATIQHTVISDRISNNSDETSSKIAENNYDATIQHTVICDRISNNSDETSSKIAENNYCQRSFLGPEDYRTVILINLEGACSAITGSTASGDLYVLPVVCNAIDRHEIYEIECWNHCIFLSNKMKNHLLDNKYNTLPQLQGELLKVLEIHPFKRGQELQVKKSEPAINRVVKKLGITFGKPATSKTIFNQWILHHMQDRAHNAASANLITTYGQNYSGMNSERSCLICFDSIPHEAKISHLKPCNHSVCVECWESYIESIAKSGYDSRIHCPGEKCQVTLDLFDAAHVLFSHEQNLINQHTFSRLLSNELEKYCLGSMNGRYCPSPDCNRLLIPLDDDNTEKKGPGWNLLSCSCGTLSCADCPTTNINKRAHPGMMCAEYTELIEKISSERADDEFKSQEWILQNSKPCPQCKFPIDRYEGCNHVWCAKCQYYFCWQCGGPGASCLSFFCQNQAASWNENSKNDMSAFGENLLSKFKAYKGYKIAQKRLQDLETKLFSQNNQAEIDDLLFEQQVQMILCWMYAFLFLKVKETDNLNTFIKPIDQMDSIAHVCEVRKFLRSHPDVLHKPFTFTQISNVIKSSVSKRKQFQKAQKSCSPLDFDELMKELECKEFCTMSQDEFKIVVKEVVKSCLQCLIKKVPRSKPKKICEDVEEPVKKTTVRCRKPWKNGFHLENKVEIAEYQLSKKVSRWKGRNRSNILRDCALLRTQEIVDQRD